MMLLSSSVIPFDVPLWALIPFILMLLMIAVGPLLFHHWWEQNKNKLIVSLVLGIPTAIWLISHHLTHALQHQLLFDYIPFIVLLGSLFVITGGIHLKGDIEAKPWINTVFLAIGAILASFMGTTGAAMLLIRPIIKTNAERKYKVHTILFFIAIVANCGGLLTPLGDPPLFLLYLRGAEFTWFLHMLPEWAFVNALLLIIYFIVDSYFYKKEPLENIIFDKTNIEPIKLKGNLNFLWLLGVVASVAFLNKGYFPQWDSHQVFENGSHGNDYLGFIREGAMVLMVICSLVFTSKSLRQANKFTWVPIVEVAFLFLGIFTTMVPALLYLSANAASFGITTPEHFYYATGSLSAFLDNAPTAVSFHNLAIGMNPGSVPIIGDGFVAGVPEILLTAVSLGAVFFGAMTYIGNGPNFMVKAIAEENKINMPSFFGYMIKFSLIVLLPIYIITQLIFI
ncbi:MAG: sodium:proton antiporter [Bacteroidales bacterium]|nr:sodium:proton antiporter [Bacteroidales bacterium]MDD2385495.1 sodium:proton antiporter [Bacteroidales bacterium]MDD4218096.1 sodium:proton antiporter [Bacteroidales bacterium]MDY0141752.1 sodium:proton antiporter [Bacteroidales bacterium]